MNSCEIVSIVTAISCAIANCVPREELPIVTAVIGQIASTLTTITVNEERIHPKAKPGGAAPGQELPDIVEDVPDVADILTMPPTIIP